MKNSDYIPSTDSGFDVFQKNLVTIVEQNLVLWSILPASLVTLKGFQSVWDTAWSKASVKSTRSPADVQEKNNALVDYKKFMRGFVAEWLSHNSKVSNVDRERMGITVHTGEKHKTSEITTRPVAKIESSISLQHTLHVSDENPAHGKGKPADAHGFELYMKIGGEVPLEPSELSFVGTDTRSTYVNRFNGKDAGKIVYYRLRWVNKLGAPGPWSIIFTAPIAP